MPVAYKDEVNGLYSTCKITMYANFVFRFFSITTVFLLTVIGCSWPSLKTDFSMLEEGVLPDMIKRDWMNSKSHLTQSIQSLFANHINAKKCIDDKCYRSFGFNECHHDQNLIIFNFHGVIWVTHDKRSSASPKKQKVDVSIQVVVGEKSDITVIVNRSGGGFIFY